MSKPEHETSPHQPATEVHGSSVAFYVFVAVVLAIITYVEFALVEHQATWFAWMSRPWLLFWLVVLSAIKFLMVVMFFMHLKQDHRAFTGFFSSGMVIAVGTLAALAALFSVRSIAEAQAPSEPEGAPTEAHGAPHGEPHGDGSEAAFGLEDNRDPLERFAHPAPKTQDVTRTELRPTLPGSEDGSGAGLGADVLTMTGGALPSASIEDPLVNPTGLVVGEFPFPLAEAAPPITLPSFFAADGTPQPLAGAPAEGEAAEEAAAPAAATDATQAAPEETAAEQTETEAAQTEAPPPAPEGGAEETGAAAASDAPLLSAVDTSPGEGVYTANCASCHQANGQGIPGAFPPLVEHVPNLALADGGREYLVQLLLYGLQGEVGVEGQAYNGVMPAWPQLSDEQIADVLNYVLSAWDNLERMPDDYPAYTPDEVAPQRDAGLSPADVYERRQALDLP
jgi:mono/diheme cytochrome c family protein/heme/copper-type cytochrome/quinol oxidase subunit 4